MIRGLALPLLLVGAAALADGAPCPPRGIPLGPRGLVELRPPAGRHRSWAARFRNKTKASSPQDVELIVH